MRGQNFIIRNREVTLKKKNEIYVGGRGANDKRKRKYMKINKHDKIQEYENWRE